MKQMINKTYKIILTALVGVLFFSTSILAASLTVDFESNPLFNESNFTPGDLIQKWAKVTNTSGETKAIITEAIDSFDNGGLGDVLRIEIKDSTTSLYESTLTDFFGAGEVYLSDLATGSTQQYDYIISFITEADNEYQADDLGFNILIGFEGGEGGAISGIGGGSVLLPPQGLTIYNEGNAETTGDSVTIVWDTSYDSTSRVIYDSSPNQFDFNDGEMSYGYAEYVDGDDIFGTNKGRDHTVTISGLASGTTYYYRCVSHASPATIGQERSFATLSAKLPLQPDAEQVLETGGEGVVPVTLEGEVSPVGEIIEGEGVGTTEEEDLTGDLTEIVQDIIDDAETDSNLGANLVNFVKNIPWWILVIVAFILFLLALLTKKKKGKK